MEDDELIAQFEAATLPPEVFRHREHVRLTWLYLRRHGRAETERRLLDGLRALAVRAGRPGKFDDALTRSWIARIDAARDGDDGATAFDQFAAARPDLLDAAPAPRS